MKLWIARDWGGLILFQYKPSLTYDNIWYNTDNKKFLELPEDLFPEITFENSPQEVELKFI